jgi:hypothetical protein
MLMLANAEDIGLELELEQIHLSELIKDTCMRQMPMSKSRDVYIALLSAMRYCSDGR